jgi:hypothetical protein
MGSRSALAIRVLSLSVDCYAEGDRWLGYFAGGVIPGYQTVETDLVVSTVFDVQHDGAYQDLISTMKAVCQKKHGQALVNMKMMPTIGQVRIASENSRESRIVSPGLHVFGYADCVLKAKANSEIK